MREPIKFGDYYLFDRIAIGGMAEVYKGVSYGVEGFERLFAVKRVLPNIAEDQEFIDMFIDEAKIAVQLTHANIGQIFELGNAENSYFIAMEFVPGKDGRALFDRAGSRGEHLPIPMVCHIIKEVCEALEYAHNKRNDRGESLELIHRDVSPQNILVSYDGEVKLIDFGIAKAAGKASKTQAGILKGKFSYMSPEQVRGKPIDRRSDLFSLAVCLYELLTLQRCFSGESDFSTLEKVREADYRKPTQINRDIPPELERIIERGLTRDPEDRYQSAADFQDELQKYLYQSGAFYSRKDLSAYMRHTFAQEQAAEQQRLNAFRDYARANIPEARRPDDPPISVVTELDPEDVELFEEPELPEADWVDDDGEDQATEVYDRDPGDPPPDDMPFFDTPSRAAGAQERAASGPHEGRSTMAQGSAGTPVMPGWSPDPTAQPGYDAPHAAGHPAMSGGHPAMTGGHPAMSGGHPAVSGAHPAAAGGHPAMAGGHPAMTGGHAAANNYPASTGAHPATSGNYPPVTGGHPAYGHTGGHPAASGGYPQTSGAHPAMSGGYPQTSGAHPAMSGGYPHTSGAHPAMTGAYGPATGGYPAAGQHGITGPPSMGPTPAFHNPDTVPGELAPSNYGYEESGGRRMWVIVLVALLSVGIGVAAVLLFADQDELASLEIETRPPAAEVYIDGRLVHSGQTPITVGNLKAGEHEVRVLADGFDPSERTVILNAGEVRRLPFELASSVAPTLLVIKSEPNGARVFIDDQLIDQTPLQHDGVEPGERQIRLEKEGYLPWTRKVRVEQGKQNLVPPVRLFPAEVAVTFLPEPEDADPTLTIRLANGAEKVLEKGERRFEGLPNDGKAVVIAEADGFERLERTLSRFSDPAATEVLTLEKSPEKPKRRTPRRPRPRPRDPEPPPAPAVAQEDGFLKLLAKPPARASIRGKDLGWTPILKHALPPGTYTVDLVRDEEPAYRDRVRVTIKPGETTFERYTNR